MSAMRAHTLRRGIICVIQTPFDADGAVDLKSLRRLATDVIEAGVDGVLAPVVASEVASLSSAERTQVVDVIAQTVAGRAPLIVGASSDETDHCRRYAAGSP